MAEKTSSTNPSFKDIVSGFLLWIILSLILIPLLIIPVTILVVWKGVATITAKCCGQDLYTTPDKMDAMQIPGPSHVHSVLGFGYVCQLEDGGPPLDIEQLRTEFLTKFPYEDPKYSRLYSTIVVHGGFPFYKHLSADTFDINKQIYEKRLEKGETLEDAVSFWIISKYPKDGGCWDIMVVNKADGTPVAVAIKTHHGLMDAYSLVHVLDRLTGNTSTPYLVKASKEPWYQTIAERIAMPSYILRKVQKGKQRSRSNPLNDPLPLTFNGVPPPSDNHIVFTKFDLDFLKSIRKRCGGVRLSCIMLAALSGALHSYFKHKDPTKASLKGKIISGVTLGIPEHPAMVDNPKSSKSVLCNRFTSDLINIPVVPEDTMSPRERLIYINQEIDEDVNHGFTNFAMWVGSSIMGYMPTSILRSMANKEAGAVAGNTGIIGGSNYTFLGKHRVTQINGIMQMNDFNKFTPLALFTFTTGNTFGVTIWGDKIHFKDRSELELFVQFFHEEMDKFLVEDI